MYCDAVCRRASYRQFACGDVNRVCIVCGKTFVVGFGRGRIPKLCGAECRAVHLRAYNRKKQREHRKKQRKARLDE